MEYIAAAYTDAGSLREYNQDSLCLRRVVTPDRGEALMAVVCDGMGGLEKGELASAECIRAFGNWFDLNYQQLSTLCEADFAAVKEQWLGLLSGLHQKLLRYAAQSNVALGTTLAAILTWGDRYLAANVGDSRLYECGQGICQLTRDQSLVAMEAERGRITEEETRHHPQRNVLLQCIGTGEHLSPAFYTGTLKGNTFYLLCTDGFWHELSPEELKKRLSALVITEKHQMNSALWQLTELCKQRGETDNITAILIRASESSIKPVDGGGVSGLIGRLRRRKKNVLPAPIVMAETAQLVHTEETIWT